MSRSDEPSRLRVPGESRALEVSVVDSDFKPVARGIGGLDVSLPPGVYEIQFRAGPVEESQLVKLEPAAERTVAPPHLRPPSAAPVEGTSTSHEYHQHAAVEASRALRAKPGEAGLVVMVRNVRGQDDLPFGSKTVAQLSLVDSSLAQVDGWSEGWRVEADTKWGSQVASLSPGGYALRLHREDAGDGVAVVDQALWLGEGWQTLVFVPNTSAGPAPEQATVHMTRLGLDWSPWGEGSDIGVALEGVLWGLRVGRPVVPRDLEALLWSKFENPLLGIVGAHALLLEPEPRLSLLDTVLDNLEGLIPGHPDLIALMYLADTAAGGPAGHHGDAIWPPLLLASYLALIRTDAFRPGVVAAGSLAETAAAQLVVQGLWTAWRPVQPQSLTRSGGADFGIGLGVPLDAVEARDPALQRLAEYVEGAAKVRAVEPETILRTPVQQLALATGLPTATVRRAIEKLTSSNLDLGIPPESKIDPDPGRTTPLADDAPETHQSSRLHVHTRGGNGVSPKYAAALDQGTTSTRCMIFDHGGQVVAVNQKEHEQIYPKPGWVEHDANEIWASTQEVIEGAMEEAGASADDIAGVGITNQRETTLVWDRNTGEPVHNALVWQDTRTDKLVDEFSKDGGQARFQEQVGLPLATYFSGPKIRWTLDNVDGAADKAESGDLMFGNMDTWLIWNLTGGTDGGLHITDVTNASRTMLMDLKTLQWDEGIAGIMGVPTSMLPEIRASSEVYGEVKAGGALQGVSIAGDLGDQQAATFGQTCFAVGEAKNTYGTGNFLLLNTGTEAVPSKSGLLTTVGYKIGDEDAIYCLEGSIAITGALVQWLRDNLKMIQAAPEVEELAKSVDDNGGCYIVPAFSGLFAPYWKSNARGVVAGLTRYVNAGHIARAALEATAFQSREVVDAMNEDSGVVLESLKVDGGMVGNDLLMQFQADILGVPVIRPKVPETTSLGAAYAAGLATGFWEEVEDLRENWVEDKRWEPTMDSAERDEYYKYWKRAVTRTFDWFEADEEPDEPEA